MNFVRFAKLCRYGIADSTTLPDADLLDLANTYKDEIAARIAKEVGEDYFGLQLTRDLIAGQREYDFPNDNLGKIKSVVAMLDGVNETVLEEVELSVYKAGMSEDSVQERWAGKSPSFLILDQSFFILSADPIIDVTDGLQLRATIYPADFTDLTSSSDMSTNPSATTHGFPRQFHELLMRRVRIAFKSSRDRPIPLDEKELVYDQDLKTEINNLKGENTNRTTKTKAPYNDGSQY